MWIMVVLRSPKVRCGELEDSVTAVAQTIWRRYLTRLAKELATGRHSVLSLST